MRIYFDCCCLNRPYDDLSDSIVRMEAEAVLSIIDICESGKWFSFSSDVLLDEILGITNVDKRNKIILLYYTAKQHIDLTSDIVFRAKQLERCNIKSYDALHAASAESAGADVLLTTDRGFINAAGSSDAKIPVKNPLVWLAEVLYDTKS